MQFQHAKILIGIFQKFFESFNSVYFGIQDQMSILTDVLDVLTSFGAFCVQVLLCLLAWRVYALMCLLRVCASMPSFLACLRAQVLTFQRAWSAQVLACLACLVAYILTRSNSYVFIQLFLLFVFYLQQKLSFFQLKNSCTTYM